MTDASLRSYGYLLRSSAFIVVKFIGTKREFGKVIIESEVTLQNPDMMVALFMLVIMKGALRA
jgi:hypothetical protein